jgi:hypothetical protein
MQLGRKARARPIECSLQFLCGHLPIWKSSSACRKGSIWSSRKLPADSISRDWRNIARLPSNEGGGSIVLGVTDRRPRRVVGTRAFEEPGRTVPGLTDRLRIKIEGTEVPHPEGRVLIFTAPPRPLACRFNLRESTGRAHATNFVRWRAC